ncbi:RDD domain-containing protein OS=Streptomyces glaucescens OX=1907 GN=SGLAU_13235 PE=4 SV=1 [Streptomyces glaucescens]
MALGLELGERLAARLIDTVVVAGVAAVAAVPLGGKALDHIQDKVDQAKLLRADGHRVAAGRHDIDVSRHHPGRPAGLRRALRSPADRQVGPHAGQEAARPGGTDIEAREPPSFGAALRRWLVYSVSGLLFVGVVGVLWCLWDKPWRQCWHDKAARTFVAA